MTKASQKNVEEAVPAKKRRHTRSSMGLEKPESSRRHVLPPVSVICHKKRGRYKKNKHSGISQPEKLTSVQTLEGGLLKKAAEIKREDILTLTRAPERDLPAQEAKYHKSCYQSLTAFMTHAKNDDVVTDTSYKKSFEKFCQIYGKKRLLLGKEILTLSKLRTAFVKIVRTEENIGCSNYRSHNLKRRLKSRFPQLVFKSNPGIGDIVYPEELAAEDLVEDVVTESDTTDTETTDTDDTDIEEAKPAPPRRPSIHDEMRNSFYSAKSMKNVIDEASSTAEIPWPPTATTVGLDSAKQLVPYQLYNWIAWTCGLNDYFQGPSFGHEKCTPTLVSVNSIFT